MKFRVVYCEGEGKWKGEGIDASFCDDGLRRFITIPPSTRFLDFEMSLDPFSNCFSLTLKRKLTYISLWRNNNHITLGKMMSRYLSQILNLDKNSSIPIFAAVNSNNGILNFI